MGQPHLKTKPSLHWKMNPLSGIRCPKENLGHHCGKSLTHQMLITAVLLIFINTIYWLEFHLQPCKESFLGAISYTYQPNFGEPPPMAGIIPVGNPVLSMPMGNTVEYTANISIIIALTQDKWSIKKKRKCEDHKLFYFNHSTIL